MTFWWRALQDVQASHLHYCLLCIWIELSPSNRDIKMLDKSLMLQGMAFHTLSFRPIRYPPRFTINYKSFFSQFSEDMIHWDRHMWFVPLSPRPITTISANSLRYTHYAAWICYKPFTVWFTPASRDWAKACKLFCFRGVLPDLRSSYTVNF